MKKRSIDLYRRLLGVLPAAFRRRNAEEMERLFTEAVERRGRSRVGLAFRVWLPALRDLLVFSVTERWRRAQAVASPVSASNTSHTGKGDAVLTTMLRDVLLTLRSLRKAPGFAAMSILTIGLGIGAATLVFSVVHGVLLQPLPYDDPGRLVNVWNDLVEERQFLPAVHPADFRDYQEMSETFEEFAAASAGQFFGASGVLTGDGAPAHVDVTVVTYNFFSMLGIDPVLGRHFTDAEDVFSGPKVALLSHELWTTRYGGDQNMVGRTIQMDGQGVTVVGVLPRGFRLLLPEEAFGVTHADVWIPVQQNFDNLPPRNWTWYTVLGRLRPEVTIGQAQSEMDRIAEELRATYPEHVTSGMQIRLVPFQQDIVKQARPALLTLFGAVGFVLLIACANVAHLLLLRGGARQREIAVRAALGASRTTIARAVFTESVVIGVFGAVLGLVLTWAGLGVLGLLDPNLPRIAELGISAPVLAFAVGAAFLTATIFGFTPAYQASRANLTDVLREGGRAGRSRSAVRLRDLLIVGEVAFSLVLLVGTGLMIRSFLALQEVRPGFEPEGSMTFGLSLPQGDYPDAESRRDFFIALHEQIGGLPGVTAVGAVSQLPLTGSTPLWPYMYEEQGISDFTQSSLSADGKWVTPGYFDAMGVQLVAGRFFTTLDRGQNDLVAIVEPMLVAQAWPDANPIGQQLHLSNGRVATVVGVVEHTRVHDIRADVREHIYLPHTQGGSRALSVVVRTAGDPDALAGAIRNEVWALDESLPIDDLRPMTAYVSDAMAESQFTMMLMSVFGLLALVLASVGIYGVISYAVDQRRHEFGIRIALGASPKGIVRSVLTGSMRLVLISIGIGIAGSIALTRAVSSLLFDVSATDLTTYGLVSIVLFGVALSACYLPARRTAKANPVSTLRVE